MTASISGSAVGAKSTTSPATVSYTAAAGRFLVLLASREAATSYFTGVTDNGGNTWTLQTAAPTSGGTGRRIEIWTCFTTASLTSVAAAFAGTSPAYIGVYDVVGQDGVDAAASTAQQNPGTGVITSPGQAVTPTTSEDLVISMIMENGSGTQTYAVSSGWTMLTPSTGSVAGGYGAAYIQNPAAGVPVAPTWTVATNAGYSVGSIAIKSSAETPGYAITVWDGSDELPASIAGVWNGASLVPGTIDQIL